MADERTERGTDPGRSAAVLGARLDAAEVIVERHEAEIRTLADEVAEHRHLGAEVERLREKAHGLANAATAHEARIDAAETGLAAVTTRVEHVQLSVERIGVKIALASALGSGVVMLLVTVAAGLIVWHLRGA